MANPNVTVTPNLFVGNTPSPFDPYAYEAQLPLDDYVSGGSVWENVNVDDYLRSAAPSPIEPARSPTPSPILGAQIRQAQPARRAQAAVLTPHELSVPIFGFDDFLAQLPKTMLPHTYTPTYYTANRAMKYYAFAEADGVPKLCMIGAVSRLQDLNLQLYRVNAYSRMSAPPMPFHQPHPPAAYYAPPVPPPPHQQPPLMHPTPVRPPQTALPSHLIFQTQHDYRNHTAPTPHVDDVKPAKKPRKNKSKQKAAH